MLVADVLDAAEVARIREALARAPFRDGRATAGPAARQVKDNEQARGDDPEVAELGRSVRQALEQHPAVQALVRPVRWSTLMFSRYAPGHRYGLHTDDAGMRDEHGWPLRTDISLTLFLSDPETYEGGALRLVGPDGERSFRPAAGSAVFYPTGLLHEVTPVTRGVRLACVGWVQSLVRRADRRELLSDLDRVRRNLPEGEDRLLLDRAVGNLLRMWGES
jgi:PKHD-type hydroxylase